MGTLRAMSDETRWLSCLGIPVEKALRPSSQF
jgi:hypothetical protein